MSYSLNSLRGVIYGSILQGTTTGVIKGDTRSLDYSSCEAVFQDDFWFLAQNSKGPEVNSKVWKQSQRRTGNGSMKDVPVLVAAVEGKQQRQQQTPELDHCPQQEA